MATTNIEWAANKDGSPGHVWNIVTGCTRKSSGCDNCYAVAMSHRNVALAEGRGDEVNAARYRGLTVLNKKGKRHFTGEVRCHEDRLDIPLKRKKPTTHFVNSMADLFHKDVPFEFIAKAWAVMARCPQHYFIILTKRPERMAEITSSEQFKDAVLHELIYTNHYYCPQCCAWYEFAGEKDVCVSCSHEYSCSEAVGINGECPKCGDTEYEMTCPECGISGGNMGLGHSECWGRDIENQWMEPWPLPNVLLGTSVEDQEAADGRLGHLGRLKLAGWSTFVSYEPALGPVNWQSSLSKPDATPPMDGIVSGGESGPGARPSHPDWHRATRDFCKEQGIAFFFKQWGAFAPNCLCAKRKACRTTERPRPGKIGVMFRCGKKQAGRELDGRTHDEMPLRQMPEP